MTQTESPSARRARLARSPAKPYPLAAIEHGEAILRLLDGFLYLTNDQIETLLFRHGATGTGRPRSPGGAAYAANTALRRLFDAGYLDRVPVFLPGKHDATVTPHYVNVLSSAGARIAAAELRAAGQTPRYRRALRPRPWQPLLHGYWVRQFAVTAQAACAAAGWPWHAWLDDRQLAAAKRRHGLALASVPDGFFLMGRPGEAPAALLPHFLEVDLGTESVAARSPARRDWRGKVEAYLAYFDRGFREEFGVGALPVVLTVTESERRLAHLLAATAAAGGGGRFWFTTRRLLYGAAGPAPGVPETFLSAPIWRVPRHAGWRTLAGRWGMVPNALQAG